MREPAEPCRSAPAPARPGLAAAASGLPWLAPGASSLAALCRHPCESAWDEVRHDAGAVLLLLRCAGARERFRAVLPEPAPLELALRHFDDPAFLARDGPAAEAVYRYSVRTAAIAYRLASATKLADGDAAWACGLLAPLGWLAACALDPTLAEGCLADPAYADDPAGTQRRWWGLDQAAVARRLARRWHLPPWLAAGRLALPVEVACRLGASAELLHTVRVASYLAGRCEADLVPVAPADAADSATALGVDLKVIGDETAHAPVERPTDPRSQPLLRELVSSAAENRRMRSAPRRDRLEDEADALHRALEESVRGQEARLREEKLTALAEFAAGAGHEINNPLAVILGQAQYVLGHDAEWFAPDPEGNARQALLKIVAQTRRIHALLRDLMQFARPAPPSPAWHDLPTLLNEVAAGLAEFAAERKVSLGVEARQGNVPAFVDAMQLKVALTCLLRNAVEAAPAAGRAWLVLRDPYASETLEIVVEDSGPGPDPAVRASLFDPFFSGRSAGRGRGLGLPTAWRLARQQGGDVRLEPPEPGGPTRFVLSLPRVESPASAVPPTALLESIVAAAATRPAGAVTNGFHPS